MQRTILTPVTLLALGAMTLGGCSAFENFGGAKEDEYFRDKFFGLALDANNLLDHDIGGPELQWLGGHGLLVVAEAATKPDRCSDDDGAS